MKITIENRCKDDHLSFQSFKGSNETWLSIQIVK